MRKALIASAVATLFAVPSLVSAQAAAPSEHTFTGNMTLTTDYRFRGISQSFKLPAVQGGIDYSHSSGIYLGTWASSISGNQYPGGAGLEWDFYGGYKFEPVKDLGLDIGLLYYYYPGAGLWNLDGAAQGGNANAVIGDDGRTKTNNLEWYVGATYKILSVKYSRTISDFFGVNTKTWGGACNWNGTVAGNVPVFGANCFGAAPGGSKGSDYIDATINYPMTEKLTLVAHVGHQRVKNYGKLNYTDYKLGVNYDLNGWILGGAYVATSADSDFYRVTDNYGGFATGVIPGAKIKDVSKDTLLFSVTKSF
ncbi:MAG: hypothetical protein EG825_05310 [Rhodocyclaceae bacterium]|nr:hypothetical protein [Rhodocyclaceae bacterium]